MSNILLKAVTKVSVANRKTMGFLKSTYTTSKSATISYQRITDKYEDALSNKDITLLNNIDNTPLAVLSVQKDQVSKAQMLTTTTTYDIDQLTSSIEQGIDDYISACEDIEALTKKTKVPVTYTRRIRKIPQPTSKVKEVA